MLPPSLILPFPAYPSFTPRDRAPTLNDLAGDLFCMFPILATLHFYRLFHLAHHQYTNDPERDPDLVSLGASKMSDQFPMPRPCGSSRPSTSGGTCRNAVSEPSRNAHPIIIGVHIHSAIKP